MTRTILIPAAGLGSRFKKEGIKTPKPLIQCGGKTLLELTLESFTFHEDDSLIIAVQKTHQVKEFFSSGINVDLNGIKINWVELDHLPQGQLVTSINALENCDINLNNELWIHNCDTGFKWNSSLDSLKTFASMPVFEAIGDHWSFAKPNEKDATLAIEVAEKRRISNLASIGLYRFKSCEEFLKTAYSHLNNSNTINNEYYIAPMLQRAIESNKTVSIPRIEGVKLYGTPEELCTTFDTTINQLLMFNPANSSNPSTRQSKWA